MVDAEVDDDGFFEAWYEETNREMAKSAVHWQSPAACGWKAKLVHVMETPGGGSIEEAFDLVQTTTDPGRVTCHHCRTVLKPGQSA